jgi:hypothetical protein
VTNIRNDSCLQTKRNGLSNNQAVLLHRKLNLQEKDCKSSKTT